MIQNDLCRKEQKPSEASASVISGVREPTAFTDDAIRRWVAEQEQQAKRVARSDPRHSAAVLTLCYLRSIITRLDHSPAKVREELEKRRSEIFQDLRTDWHERNPSSEPPLELLRSNAERQAYCEVRADVVELLRRILSLHKPAGQTTPQHRIRHRSVKRIR